MPTIKQRYISPGSAVSNNDITSHTFCRYLGLSDFETSWLLLVPVVDQIAVESCSVVTFRLHAGFSR